jgi:transposase
MVLLDKYLYSRPTHRLCQGLEHHGLHLSQGTLTDGLQRLKGLFEPLMPVLYARQMTEKLFHGDETRWEVFEEVEGKTGHRWYLWVMRSVSVVYYRMAPGQPTSRRAILPSCERTCSTWCWCVTATVPTKA